ncbi:hypothetical protein [Streptococcus parauberis]|uniref:hypothetical protein n=1 Tax=Streptococcus parauberis TaxID=1348 RepID=UPI000C551303|nr:hypothetical protein [Streptococcus parauberis]PIO78096.1 hypothetical protein ADO05_01899 [Streptococcus parauberis]POS68389.1 hypothetical protein AOS90_00069 [Streptococcus parauberis]
MVNNKKKTCCTSEEIAIELAKRFSDESVIEKTIRQALNYDNVLPEEKVKFEIKVQKVLEFLGKIRSSDIFYSLIYREGWHNEKSKDDENGVGKNDIKSRFTNDELKKILGVEEIGSIDDPVRYVFVGISRFGDIIEVGRSSVTSKKEHGDWTYAIRIQKGVSPEYLKYVGKKTEGSYKTKSSFLNELLLNLNKFYERIIFIPIKEEKNKETDTEKYKDKEKEKDEIASQIETYIGEYFVKTFIKEYEGEIEFVRPDSHLSY